MAFSFTVVDVVMVSTFFYLLVAFQDHRRRKGLPYPPGPKPWPIIGNLFNSPRQSPWIAYAEMAKKHGSSDFVDSPPPLLKLAFTFARPHSVLSSFWAGCRGALLRDRDQRPTRQARGNLLGSACLASATNVHTIPASGPCSYF